MNLPTRKNKIFMTEKKMPALKKDLKSLMRKSAQLVTAHLPDCQNFGLGLYFIGHQVFFRLSITYFRKSIFFRKVSRQALFNVN
jgi:hypothetical protein